MRVIIAGTRHLNTGVTKAFNIIDSLVKKSKLPSVILCGCGGNVDAYGNSYGIHNGIPVKHFPAAWDRHGKAAGPIRNQVMVDEADMLFLIWDGESRGSRDVLRKARKKGIPVQQVVMKNGDDKRTVIWKFEEI